MDVQITKKNGESFTLEEYGILVKDFVVSSIPVVSEYGDIERSHRKIDYGATYGARTITVPFRLQAYDLMDFPLLRDTLFGLINGAESYYIREMRRPKKLNYAFVNTNEAPKMDPQTENRLVGGKRYLVRLQNTFDIEQIEVDGEGELVFETTELPFAESIGATQDIQQNGINAADEQWGFGMGLIDDPDSHRYTHAGTSFRLYNAGNVPVHPFEQELKITISNIQGSTSFFELKNKTNGSLFRTTEGASGMIVIDGPNVTRNGLAYLRKTTKDFIELSPGWNEFEISGATHARVEFDFRFYYL